MRSWVCGGWLALALAASGCAHSSGPVFEKYPYPETGVAVSVADVTVRDSRQGVAAGHFDTPTFSWPGDGEEQVVEVTAGTKAELGGRLRRLLSGGSPGLIVEVEIKKGVAGWEASWTAETAYASVALDVVFIDAETGSVLLHAWGEAWGRQGAMDVTDEAPSALFQAAVLAAFDRAVASPAAVQRLREIAR